MTTDLETRRQDRRLERWRTNQSMLAHLSPLLHELWGGEGATVDGEWAGDDDPERGGRLVIVVSYGSWRIGTTRSGSTLVELFQHVKGLKSEREALDACHAWLRARGDTSAGSSKSGAKVKIIARLPIPADHLVDWSKEALDTFAFWTRAGMPPTMRPNGRWEYRDAADNLLFYACRFEMLDGSSKLYRKLAWFGPTEGYKLETSSYQVPAPWPLNGLKDLADRPDADVLVVEGEKTAEAARKLLPTYAVVTWPGGDKSVYHVDWSALFGRKVTLWPDNDNVGLGAMQKVQAILMRGITADVSVVPVATLGVPHSWDLADPIPTNLDPFTVAKGAHDMPDWLVDINRRCFVALEGGKAVVFTNQENPLTGLDDLVRMRAYDLCLLEDNKRIMTVDSRGNPILAGRGTVWLTHRNRREYAGTVFQPSNDIPPGFYNLWRGFSVKPKTGRPRRFLRFIWRVICKRRSREFKYVIRWLANLVQHPERPGMTAVVLTGKKGVGKGFLADTIGSLMKPHYAPLSSYEQVTGRFNGYMRHVVFVFLDEAFYAGDRKHIGMINSLITEKLRQYEHKGYDQVIDYNRAHVLIASNMDWVIPASLDERRYAVLDVSTEYQRDTIYFGALKRALDGGEREQLLNMLQQVNLENWTPLDVPQNQELAAQKLESLDDCQSFIAMRLRDGDWRVKEQTSHLYESYLKHCEQVNFRRPRNGIQLGRSLSKLFGEAYYTKPLRTGDTSTRWAFLPDEKTARRILAEKLGLTVKADGDRDEEEIATVDAKLPF